MSGNTFANVPISLFTDATSVSYIGIHWVTTPPGVKCSFTSVRYSSEYNVAAPRTHGWIGSDVMTSNFDSCGPIHLRRNKGDGSCHRPT